MSDAGWGAKIVDQLSRDLRAEFPGMKGFSPRNLRYMREFARVWSDPSMLQQLVAKIPWGHHTILLTKAGQPRGAAVLRSRNHREWLVAQYARASHRATVASAAREGRHQLHPDPTRSALGLRQRVDLGKSVSVAVESKHPAYDMMFVALAERLGKP